MSAPEIPSHSDPRAQAPREAEPAANGPARPTPDAPPGSGDATPHKRPWGWIAVAGLLAAGVIGLGIYAMNLDSDLDDANAQIASQQEQIDQAENRGADVAAAAKSAYEGLTARLGAAQGDASQAVEQASAQLDQAEQAAEDAKGTADELQKQADAARAKADTAATCAQSFLSAFSGVFAGETLEAGVEATVAELQALQPQCAPALGQG